MADVPHDVTADDGLVHATSQRTFWERTRVGWHVVVVGLLALLAAALLLDRPWDRGTGLGLAIVAGLAALYVTVGRRALGADDTRLGLLYLVPAWLLFTVLVWSTPYAFALLFMLFPQTWAMLPSSKQAAAVTIGGCLLLFGVQIPNLGVAGAAVAATVNAGLALLLGLWINGIMTESDRRADLIDTLQRTQAQLAMAEHERGVLAERERVAAEIHDTLAQGFTSVLTLAQAIEAEPNPQVRVRHLALLQQTARENLAEARALVAALAPVDLDNDLPHALRRLVDRFTEQTGVLASLHVDGDATGLPPSLQVVLLRAAQEALTNVRRHAAATAARVELRSRSGEVELTVTDDGRGIDEGITSTATPTRAATPRHGPEHGPGQGLGLAMMRRRVESVGGALEVRPSPGLGTTVLVTVPVDRAAPAPAAAGPLPADPVASGVGA
jgi:signal transduction histidine kinase